MINEIKWALCKGDIPTGVSLTAWVWKTCRPFGNVNPVVWGCLTKCLKQAVCVCVCVCVCVWLRVLWECIQVWLCTHSEHMSMVRSRGSLSHCGEATEVWAVWQWHEVTDRLRQILGQWVGCVDSTVCMSVCERTWLCKFLYCMYSIQGCLLCSQKSEHWGVSPMAVILAPEKGLCCSLLFPHWQAMYWQGLPSLHPNKQRGRLWGRQEGRLRKRDIY